VRQLFIIINVTPLFPIVPLSLLWIGWICLLWANLTGDHMGEEHNSGTQLVINIF
jgi:hypothetical protein